MSLITRCPACQTSFRVVPDQLRISDGWVRCGQCEEVFDGAAYLQQEPSPAQPPAAPSQPAEVPSQPAEVPPVVDFELHDLALGPVAPETAQPADEALASQAGPIRAELPPDPASAPIDGGAAADDQPVGFMRKMPEISAWRKPWVRAGLGLATAGLLVVLAVQVVVQERDRLASLVPQARPLITRLCAVMNCEVAALRQIESIVIDSSSFAKTRGDAYRLALVVKNQAPIHLAMPWFELTLTDSQDQPVARRVLAPSDFGAASRLMAADSEWSAGLDLAVRASTAGERFSGYRILAFYP